MHTRISGFACAALLCLTGLPASAEVAGSMAIAGHGPEQDDLTGVFTSVAPDSAQSLDAAEDVVDLPTENGPEMFRRDVATITAGSTARH